MKTIILGFALLFPLFTSATQVTIKIDHQRAHAPFEVQNAIENEDPITHRWGVKLNLNAESSKRLRILSRRNLGKEMSVFLKSELLVEAKIQVEIEKGGIYISKTNSKEEAKSLADRINGKAI